MSPSPIWITGQPQQSRPGGGPATRWGDVTILDASLGIITSNYTSGWSPYHKQSMSHLFDTLSVKPGPDYQVVRQRALHALEAALKNAAGKIEFKPGPLAPAGAIKTSFEVTLIGPLLEMGNGEWWAICAADKPSVPIEGQGLEVEKEGEKRRVVLAAGMRRRGVALWVNSQSKSDDPTVNSLRLGTIDSSWQREYHSPGSWTHTLGEWSGWEWNGSCELGRRMVDNWWTTSDFSQAKTTLSKNLTQQLGVRGD